jgi:hypothetical protein
VSVDGFRRLLGESTEAALQISRLAADTGIFDPKFDPLR